MKTESQIKPKEKYRIENIQGNTCDIIFYDNIKEEQRTIENENYIVYVYNEYKITVQFRDNLESDINDNFDTWFNFAKQNDYDTKANEIRTKRNKLLEETDNNMILDRLNFEIPNEITEENIPSIMLSFFNVLNDVKNGSLANYRQQLRDITKQVGFPYNVEFPNKPE